MALSKTAIVQGLQGIVGGANVITDEKELKQSSIDRLRLYEDVHGVFTRPIPAAVVMARSTQHGAEVLKYANKSRINVVARTGRTAAEGGREALEGEEEDQSPKPRPARFPSGGEAKPEHPAPAHEEEPPLEGEEEEEGGLHPCPRAKPWSKSRLG